MFRVIPAVDIKDGRCVQLRQGNERDVIFESDSPLEIAKMWVERGARVLHVVDLSGSFEGKLRHEDVILRISQLAEVQVGGGIRDPETAERLLKRGVDRIIFGTIAIENSDVVKELAEKYPSRIMIAIDSRGGRVVVKGWKEDTCMFPEDVARVYEEYDVSFLFTDVNVEGLMKGIDEEAIKKVVSSTERPVYVAGGISSAEDVLKIKKAGAAGAVIGSALYTGKINYEKLISMEED